MGETEKGVVPSKEDDATTKAEITDLVADFEIFEDYELMARRNSDNTNSRFIFTTEDGLQDQKWKELFNSAGDARAKYGVKVLAYGHPKDNENKVYQVLEIESMEKMQEAMQDPEIAKARTDAGVDLHTQEVVFLVE